MSVGYGFLISSQFTHLTMRFSNTLLVKMRIADNITYSLTSDAYMIYFLLLALNDYSVNVLN
ncbi:hypothetical protein COU87_04160, partial [Candidatus Roizmanbacteria bacterium CG10_big_fil_rev_8_21_14_0_10_39_12]